MPPTSQRWWSRRRYRDSVAFYAFASPVLLGLIIFRLGPIAASLYLSLQRVSVVDASFRWVGLQNYQTLLFHDPLVWVTLANTVYYTGLVVALQVTLGLGLAILLDQKVLGQGVLRTIYYLPELVPGVAASILWLWIFDGQLGPLNLGLSALGLPAIGWLGDPAWSKASLVLMSLWTIGQTTLLYLAGLQGVSAALLDAARVDGAGPWSRLRHVILPILSPVIFFNLIVGVIRSFQVFVNAYVMTGGGPLDSSRFYVLYLYQQAFQFNNLGYASAMAWGLFLLVAALTALQFRLLGPRIFSELSGRR